jgi:hypothetical protein
MITAQDSLLQDNTLGLQVDGLKEVPELELNACKLGNASSDLLVHGTCHLKKSIDRLTVEIERTFKGTFLVGLLSLSEQGANVIVLKLKMLDNWEYFSEV